MSKSKWVVEVLVNNLDSKELEEGFSNGSLSLIKIENKYYISSKEWELEYPKEKVFKDAEQFTNLIDKALHLYDRTTSSISIGNVVEIDSEHKIDKRYLLLETNMLMGIKLKFQNLPINQDNDNPSFSVSQHINKVILKASNNRKIEKVLDFMKKPDWINLYKAFEIVRDEVGKEGIIKQGWLTEKTYSRFTLTAQSSESIGDDARHASQKYKPHKEPMTITEAKLTIRQLVQKWIDSE